MTLDDLKSWLGVFSGLIAIGSFAYAWLTNRSKLNSEQIAGLEETVNTLETQVKLIEQRLEQMPDKETVHELGLKVTELHGQLNVMGESLKSVAVTASRIENFLLQNGSRA